MPGEEDIISKTFRTNLMKSNIAGPKVALIKLPAGREREREGEKVEKEKEGNYEGKIQYSGQGREGRTRERRK